MGRAVLTVTVLTALALAASLAQARDPSWGGLGAVAVSPDGKTLATGGTNRTLYILDAADLKVTQRIWFRARIGALAFSKNGAILVVEDDDETLHFLDVKTFKPVKKVEKTGFIAVCRSADLLAGVTGSYRKREIVLLSMTDGSQKGKIAWTEKTRPGRIALAPDGKKLVVLTEKEKGDEKKVSYSQIPKDLKGAARHEFVQKHDGYVSKLLTYEVPSGKLLKTLDLWYTSDGNRTDIVLAGDETIVFNYSAIDARITAKGETTVFETKSSGYGRGVSLDHKAFLTGSLRSATHVKVDGLVMTELSLDDLPGWPEYFAAFTFLADGSAYGVTSAHRLVKISKTGSLVKTGRVY